MIFDQFHKGKRHNNAAVVGGKSGDDDSTVEVWRRQRRRRLCGNGGGNNDNGCAATEVATLRPVEQRSCSGGLGGWTNGGGPLAVIDGM